MIKQLLQEVEEKCTHDFKVEISGVISGEFWGNYLCLFDDEVLFSYMDDNDFETLDISIKYDAIESIIIPKVSEYSVTILIISLKSRGE